MMTRQRPRIELFTVIVLDRVRPHDDITHRHVRTQPTGCSDADEQFCVATVIEKMLCLHAELGLPDASNADDHVERRQGRAGERAHLRRARRKSSLGNPAADPVGLVFERCNDEHRRRMRRWRGVPQLHVTCLSEQSCSERRVAAVPDAPPGEVQPDYQHNRQP